MELYQLKDFFEESLSDSYQYDHTDIDDKNNIISIYIIIRPHFSNLHSIKYYLEEKDMLAIYMKDKRIIFEYQSASEKSDYVIIYYKYSIFKNTYLELLNSDLNSVISSFMTSYKNIDYMEIISKYKITDYDYLNILKYQNKYFYDRVKKFLSSNLDRYYIKYLGDSVFNPIYNYTNTNIKVSNRKEHLEYYKFNNPLLMKMYIWANYPKFYQKLVKYMSNSIFDENYRYFDDNIIVNAKIWEDNPYYTLSKYTKEDYNKFKQSIIYEYIINGNLSDKMKSILDTDIKLISINNIDNISMIWDWILLNDIFFDDPNFDKMMLICNKILEFNKYGYDLVGAFLDNINLDHIYKNIYDYVINDKIENKQLSLLIYKYINKRYPQLRV